MIRLHLPCIVRSGRVDVAVLLEGAHGAGVLFVNSQTMQPAVVPGAIAVGTVGSMITTSFGSELALAFTVFLVEMLLE
jgi:hypothetical protein